MNNISVTDFTVPIPMLVVDVQQNNVFIYMDILMIFIPAFSIEECGAIPYVLFALMY